MSEELLEEKVVESEEEVVAQDEIMQTVVHGENDPVVSTKKLLEAGCHFGHQTRRWDPKMSKYIYSARNGLHIIDLVKTAESIQTSYQQMKKIVAEGGKVLFVGTTPAVREIVAEEAIRSGSFFVNNRWLGGTLTNFRTISKRIKYLNSLEAMENDGSIENISKKEAAVLRKEKERLLKNLEGIKEMRKVPNAVFVVDPKVDHNAVLEAHKLRIPVFAICDTNANPDEVDYVIPANNVATKSVGLIVSLISDAVVEAKGGQTIASYGVQPEEEVSMVDALNSYDKQEELRQIRQRIREDMIAEKRKDGKPSRKPVKKVKPQEAKEAKPAEEKAEEAKEEAEKVEE